MIKEDMVVGGNCFMKKVAPLGLSPIVTITWD